VLRHNEGMLRLESVLGGKSDGKGGLLALLLQRAADIEDGSPLRDFSDAFGQT
jgi:hypothetical protein